MTKQDNNHRRSRTVLEQVRSNSHSGVGQTFESSTGVGHADEREDRQVTRSTACQEPHLEVKSQN